jgi:transcriptional regulator with XRE-family HTH domain
MSEISERLKEARHRAGLSTTKVSKMTRISEGNLSDLEKGVYKPSTKTLLHLSEVYRVSIDWLLKGEESNLYEINEENREITMFLQRLFQKWEKSDEATRGWIIVQLRRAFPELAEELQEMKQRNNLKQE